MQIIKTVICDDMPKEMEQISNALSFLYCEPCKKGFRKLYGDDGRQ